MTNMMIKVNCPICGGSHEIDPHSISVASFTCGEACTHELTWRLQLALNNEEYRQQDIFKPKYKLCPEMRVKVKLLRKYTKAELEDNCTDEVDGKTGVIDLIADNGGFILYDVKLDNTLRDNDGGEFTTYYEYDYNLEPIGQDGWYLAPTSCVCGGNIAWLYAPPGRAHRMFGCACHNCPPFDNNRDMKKIMLDWGLLDA